MLRDGLPTIIYPDRHLKSIMLSGIILSIVLVNVVLLTAIF